MAEIPDRFRALGRLYGASGWARLQQSRVAVVGLGGVGSWAVEALARSGVGYLRLIDLDEICLSNINRQLPALTSVVGQPKAEVMGARCRDINPEVEVDPRPRFFTARTADSLLEPPLDLVIDAIDDVPNKCHLLAACRERDLPIVTCGGAGGRRDPAAVQCDDLARTHGDPLLSRVRKRLRQEHGFPAGKRDRWGIPCVFTAEKPVYPRLDGTVCDHPEPGADFRLNCDGGYGTATFVTGTVGFHLAAAAVRELLGEEG